ncbi:hypothetical protein ACFXTH_007283 [Malus domestica]
MKLAQKGIIELDLDDVVKSNFTTITYDSFDTKFSPQPLGACSKSSKVKGWTQVTPKKLHKKHTSPPQVRQSERGQNSSCQPSKQREHVEDDKIAHKDRPLPSRCVISCLKTSSTTQSRLLAMKIAMNDSLRSLNEPKLLARTSLNCMAQCSLFARA